jgi:choline dehydrogenase-like flavoprotein
MEMMEAFNESLTFGFMVKDTSRGRVRAAPGEPLVSYWVNDDDLKRVHRGLGLLARVYFAAGAREVLLPVLGWERLRSVAEVEAFEAARFPIRHVDLTAYHPLGTARLGLNPLTSVVGPEHETHDVHHLYICDGSAVPGPPGVNPQVTIMALALRAADSIARRLER